MAFEIATPDVGTRMLRTFSVLSEENRKRQEFQLNQEKALQGIMLKDAALTIREQGQQLNAVKTANNYEIALAKLALATGDAERKAAETNLNLLKKQFELDRDQADLSSAGEAASILAEPGKDGRTLHQRLMSGDAKESEEAMREFVGAAGRLQGKGTKTAGLFDAVRRNFNDTQRLREGQLQAELNARKEERMASTAEGAAARAERSLTNQEKRTEIMQTEAERRKAQAFGGGSKKGAGEFYPGGSAKVKVPGFGILSLDQIRETLAAGGEVATKLKTQMKSMNVGATAEGEPIASPWDDAALSELETQGKKIQQQKAGASTPKTPSGVSVEPVADPAGLDAIFERGGARAPAAVPAAADGLPSPEDLGLLPPLGAAARPQETFFGLPRDIAMA